MARVPQKYGLFWAYTGAPPPPSNVKMWYCSVPASMAPRSSAYEASMAGYAADPSSVTAWTPAAGSPDLWS